MASMYEVEKQIEAIQAQLEVIAALLGIEKQEPPVDPNA